MNNTEVKNKKISKTVIIVVAVVLFILLDFIGYAWYFGGGLEGQAENELNYIYQKTAIDAVEQYQIAKQSGNLMDACVRAGIVSASFLQMKDEKNYKLFKDLEKSDCNRAGLLY